MERSSIPLSDVNSTTSLYPTSVYSALSMVSPAGYEVLAQEVTGEDRDAHLVMAYRLPFGVPLRWDLSSSLDHAHFFWRTRLGWARVTDNSKVRWPGVSVHTNDSFGLVTSQFRCLLKTNFSAEIASSTLTADYKQFHYQPPITHTGTTRCLQNAINNNGIAHWIRPLST